MRKRALRINRPRSGIVWAHMTCDKQIWSLAHCYQRNPLLSHAHRKKSKKFIQKI
uniref:AlNc14C143G7318 protein n=1 Tax=Albugo laibachii Nc14 TaxID=890382 RepID=F0WLD0_9STRA|nr:AlNc14C143G7318 [Albugo laibachii Nc14]|eukprot:CCA22093.1 AlNc14C143G7318 [Albugo laibachii Nc14]